MKEQKKIPTGKVQRASRMVRTGAKVGRNYVRHYTKKIFNKDLDRAALDAKNAEDIYDELSQLKGGALKVAQMLSMDKGMLPREYTRQFANAQYSAPPLSGPLVVKTFREQFGKSPHEVFDEFDLHASHAASIGQVHRAVLDGKVLAVKVQYPGVADSIVSDLRMVRPLAARFMKTSSAELAPYFEEVQERLLEETDYILELKNSMEISQACAHIENLHFPQYFPELSGERIITMEWLEGQHLKEFMQTEPSQEVRNKIGRALWEFITHQIHELGKVHADPHPGNFLMTPDGRLGVLDFGCVKVIPDDFHRTYFSVLHPEVRNNPKRLLNVIYDLELLNEQDSQKDEAFILGVLGRFLDLVEKPFFQDVFDFGDDAYLNDLIAFGMEVGQMSEAQGKGARGSRHALYINRTFIGMFSLLNDLKAKINAQDKYLLEMEF